MKNEETAKRLKIAMERKKITAKELSDKSGVSEPSISQYVHGTFAPRNITAGKLADALDVDPMWLMGFEVEMVKPIIPTEHLDYYIEGITDITGSVPGYTDKGVKIQELFQHLKKLNADGIEKLIDRAKELEEVPKYKMKAEVKIVCKNCDEKNKSKQKKVPKAALS